MSLAVRRALATPFNFGERNSRGTKVKANRIKPTEQAMASSHVFKRLRSVRTCSASPRSMYGCSSDITSSGRRLKIERGEQNRKRWQIFRESFPAHGHQHQRG